MASILIILISGALFVYWFRYMCLLILSTRTAKDYAQDVAAANQLTFLDIRTRLSADLPDAGSVSPMFDQVHRALDRDYRLVTYLLEHAANSSESTETLEHWLLRLDYRIMGLWYRVVRGLSGQMARRALLEMSSIVSHLANNMGQRLAVSVRT